MKYLKLFFCFSCLVFFSDITNGQTLFAEVTPASFTGSSDGAIDLTVNYGYPPHTFEWSTTETTEDIENLLPGTYTVHVYDRYCGVVSWDLQVYSCDGINVPSTITETHTNASTSTSSNGQIDITVDGISTGNYTYQWTKEPSQEVISTEEDLDGLSPGTYCVRVVNACGGGSASACITITSCDMDVSMTRIAGCLGLPNSSLYLNVTGNAPFAYEWSNGATTQNLENVYTGTYYVTITDVDLLTIVDTQLVEFHKKLSC